MSISSKLPTLSCNFHNYVLRYLIFCSTSCNSPFISHFILIFFYVNFSKALSIFKTPFILLFFEISTFNLFISAMTHHLLFQLVVALVVVVLVLLAETVFYLIFSGFYARVVY